MLRANQAVRLGLRAASRNPELAFGKALLDLAGTVLGLLPVLWAASLLLAAFGDRQPLQALLSMGDALRTLTWPLFGAALAGSILSWALATAFWAGALPVLAADAEMQQRPPKGTFLSLAVRGFSRVAAASAVMGLISLAVSVALGVGGFFLPLALAAHPSIALSALAAASLSGAALLGALLDLLARLVLIRAAALGDSVTVAFGRAANLLGARLGACLVVAGTFFVLELLVATSGGALAGTISASTGFAAADQLLSLAPRTALAVATGVVFAWLETARQGALAALAADAEGLIVLAPEPEPEPLPRRGYRIPQTWELRPPPLAVTPPPRPGEAGPEQVVEALPVAEQVVEALPVPEERVIEALPVIDGPAPQAGPDDEPGQGSGAG